MDAVNPTTQDLERAVKLILQRFDKDPEREGLKDTPKRYVKFLEEFLAPEEFSLTTFNDEKYDQMVIQKDIPFFSLCEHHLAPFFGTAAVAYIPGEERIVGLSKLARVVDKFSRRFQNQERITCQVAEFLNNKLSPRGVGVSIKAQHLCMSMRGIKKHDTWTITNALTGFFHEVPSTRAEFMSHVA